MIILGLDMATTTDLASCVLYFPDEHRFLAFFWIPEDPIVP